MESMTRSTLTPADEGKRVVDETGTEVGRLVKVSDGRGYVDPNPSFLDSIKAVLGWGDVYTDAHPLDDGSVAKITEDTVYLRGTL